MAIWEQRLKKLSNLDKLKKLLFRVQGLGFSDEGLAAWNRVWTEIKQCQLLS
jgi:hypothetical protein